MLKQLDSTPDQVVFVAEFPHFTPQTLFEYWTQAERVTAWWAQAAEIENGRYHFSWPAMNWHLRGRHTAHVPGETLGFTWKFDHEPGLPERQVALRFEARPEGGARLTLTHGQYSASPADQADRQAHIDGWNHFLAQLQKLQTVS